MRPERVGAVSTRTPALTTPQPCSRPSELDVTFRRADGEHLADGEHFWEVVSNADRPVHGADCKVSLPSGDFRLTVCAAPLPDAAEGIVVAIDDAEPL